jgi:hypothetical protein
MLAQEEEIIMQRVVMIGCNKHHRIKTSTNFIPVSPEFFYCHIDGVVSKIEIMDCDECLSEKELSHVEKESPANSNP